MVATFLGQRLELSSSNYLRGFVIGIFGPKLTDVDYYGSIAITYGQAIDAIESSEVIDQHRASELHGALLTIASAQIEAMSGESYFADLYSHHFSGAMERSHGDKILGFLLINDDLITQLGSSLSAAFSRLVSRDDALAIGVRHVEWLSKHWPVPNSQSVIEEAGYCIGLAMKTIMDNDQGNRPKIAVKRITLGALVGANWSAAVLASPQFE